VVDPSIYSDLVVGDFVRLQWAYDEGLQDPVLTDRLSQFF
jgi:hypothetical protein